MRQILSCPYICIDICHIMWWIYDIVAIPTLVLRWFRPFNRRDRMEGNWFSASHSFYKLPLVSTLKIWWDLTSVELEWEDPENHRFYGIFSESRCVASSRILVDIWCTHVDWVSMYVYHRAVTAEFRYCLIEWVIAEIFAKISLKIKLRTQMVVISVPQNGVWMIWSLVHWFQ